MFKFNFDVDEDPEIDEVFSSRALAQASSAVKHASTGTTPIVDAPFIEHDLDVLLRSLPDTISFSPIHISLAEVNTITLSKRDLFDARFHLISTCTQLDDQDSDDLRFVEAPSDLIPGVYEGGLKTWECSVDLAGYLQKSLGPNLADSLKKKRILELGCGTALPSIGLLHGIFAQPPDSEQQSLIHLQDYNELVFRLEVVPNLILAWYMSPAADAFRGSVADPDDEDDYPPPDPSQAGHLAITSALITAFHDSLERHSIKIQFFSGSWQNFNFVTVGGRYDIVLTSETIYQLDSLPSLLDVMWHCCVDRPKSLEELTSELDIVSDQRREHDCLCLVAAKLVYFGLGGGVTEFIDAVESPRQTGSGRHPGSVDTVWKNDAGVKRVITKVHWK